MIPAGLSFLAGLVMGLAAAPLNWWGLAWLMLTPLWLAIGQPQRSLRSAMGHSCLWGVAYHGLSLSWLTGLHPLTWMGIPWLVSLAIAGGCWLLITLWGTLFVALWGIGMWSWQHRLIPRLDGKLPDWLKVGLGILIGTTLWCSLETLRSFSPLDWTPLAFTQSPGNLAILHLGQLSGPMTITAAIATVNGGWATSLHAAFFSHPRREVPSLKNWVSCGWPQLRLGFSWTLLLLVIWHGVGYGLEHGSPWLRSQPENLAPIRIGIIQGNVPTRYKLTPNGIQQARDRYRQGYETLAAQGVDLVITPEAAIPLYWNPHHPVFQSIVAAVRAHQVPLVLGTFVTHAGNSTQSLVVLNQNGELTHHYDKVKLVLLGEYIPPWLQGLVPRLSTLTGSLTPGMWEQTLQTPVGQAAAGICYDSAFSDLLRSQVAAGGTFLITASNLDPYSTGLMAQVHAHEVMRAIETDRPLVRATNTGFSGAITAHGKTTWLSAPQVLTHESIVIQPHLSHTLYTRWGNWLTSALNYLSLSVLVWLTTIKSCPAGKKVK